ncbi:MAG: alpha/beta hydrolase [Acetobacteraceae bacterium]|nr:alpha/beta hydrolase [Acetobacteraceae bacterium]
MADPEIAAIRASLAANPRPPGLEERRKRLDALASQHPLPADVRIEEVDVGGVPAEWSSTPQADPDRVILFLHGGGYVSGSLVSHRAMVAEAGRLSGARTLALGYRLAPEHPFPAAFEDTMAGYRSLLSQGFDSGRIAIAGDSAGGGLTIAALVSIREAGLPLPACGWCVSPWVDLAGTGDSLDSKAEADPMIQRDYLQELAAAYLHGADPRSPAASPLYADLRGLPPLLIQVGSAETLLDDSVRLARKAGAEDVWVRLEVWPEMIHVWHLFYPQLAAGRRALASAGAFIRAELSGSG